MIATLVVLAVITLSIVFFFRINWGLVSVIVLLPFERIGSFALNPSAGYPIVRLVQIAGAALIAAYFLRVILQKEHMHYLPSNKWLLALGVWAIVPVAVINYGPLWRDYVFGLFVLLLAFVFAQLSNPERRVVMLKALFATTIAVGLYGLYQFIGNSFGLSEKFTGLRHTYSRVVFGFPRIHATESEPLFYANYLLLPSLLSASWLLNGIKEYRKTTLLVLILSLTSLVLTTSRGGILALSVGGLVLVALAAKQKVPTQKQVKRLALAGSVAVILAVLGITVASYRTYKNPLTGPKLIWTQSTTQISQTGSYTERKASLSLAFNKIKQQPLIGYGIGGYTYKLRNYPQTRSANDRIAINNEWVELTTELGFVGLFLFIGLLISALKGAYDQLNVRYIKKPERAIANGLIATTIAIVIQFMFFSSFFITYSWVAFGLLMGLYSLNSKTRSAS